MKISKFDKYSTTNIIDRIYLSNNFFTLILQTTCLGIIDTFKAWAYLSN